MYPKFEAPQWEGRNFGIFNGQSHIKINLNALLYFTAGVNVFILDPDYAKRILVTNTSSYDRDMVIQRILPYLGTGLITTYGKDHAVMRKHLNPAFTLGSVKQFMSTFNEKGLQLVKVAGTEYFHSKPTIGTCRVTFPKLSKLWFKILSE